MVTKTQALEWALENASKKKGSTKLKYVNLEEWIKLNFNDEQQKRMWRYCNGFEFVESQWIPAKRGFEMGIYEIYSTMEGLDEENQEIFSEGVPYLTPFGQVLLKDLYRLCSKYNVAPYYNN